mmetsp:Transcript_552/g.796  ORF Transcript_552/g.796 Transcript_552/m.796 type:complete len:463 (+) Transcript_552:294-1682(+)|eukprot:CAMPEP_0184526540 /NCGR_PEP_ID=MMETSP0198_2-20121128/10709_1 /TAXON_ID=1112570 /ORGANISM="Thraustochytrium sp., Strain LLF1b" /LENGTH=462 /DNA_ID=CAMNT_0026918119 /DNA_START=194 /DNA_END=1582 /DNA_ORIENTATION=+
MLDSDLVRTIVGGCIEVFGAQLFIVAGLSIQKVAVMKIIETDRLRSAEEPGVEAGTQTFSDTQNDDNTVPLLEDSNSESMTVMTDRSLREANALNDTQVPNFGDLARHCDWLAGLGIFVIGNILELVALSFASQTDVALLTNFALIWNAVASVWIFNENFQVIPPSFSLSYETLQRWDLLHCGILLIGSMIAVVCTPAEPGDNLDAKELLRRWGAPPYVYWGSFMLVVMFFTTIFLVCNWRNLKTGNLNAALMAGLSGFMSAFCVTLSKVATTLVSNTIQGNNQFDNPEAVFLVALWAVMLVSQLMLLNVALGAFEQGMIVPIYEVVGTIAAITSGILFYRTYYDFTFNMWVGFGIGVFMMSAGVWLVAHREVHTQQELSNNFYSNLSAVDDLLRITNFSRTLSEGSFITYTQSAALDGFDDRASRAAMLRLYGASSLSDNEDNDEESEEGVYAYSNKPTIT